MAQASGFKQVGYVDCSGGGQVVVDGTTAYVGHIKGPEATSVFDVSDPMNPRLTESFDLPWSAGVHSHKVNVQNGLMLTNIEAISYIGPRPDDFVGGLNIYDASDPLHPKFITKWECGGSGIHRYSFDGRYAYISPCLDGYRSNIVMILDLANPSKPEEVGRWWMPGQWEAGGEEMTVKPEGQIEPRCHHPIRMGDRLYTSYWHGGFFILDISDMTRPKFVSAMDWTPVYGWPSHTCLPIPFEIEGRKLMLVADECAVPKSPDAVTANAMLWMVDITDETNPVPFSTFRVEGSYGSELRTCHQPAEDVKGTEIPVAWFDYGLRMIDISDPHALREVAYYVPDPHPSGDSTVKSNDVCWDDRGLIYVIDRWGGLSIVERI